MQRGKFITFEGGEGGGKSTQTAALVGYLRGCGFDVVQTREVGGAPGAEEIRKLWLGKENGYWDAVTEALLVMAARRDHLVKTVWPAMARGAWVVSDRHIDSARAYQGLEGGVIADLVESLYKDIAGDFRPDLTLLLDIPVDLSLARMQSRGGATDRFEGQDKAFHQKLRDKFLQIAADNKARTQIVDASLSMDAVKDNITKIVNERFAIKHG